MINRRQLVSSGAGGFMALNLPRPGLPIVKSQSTPNAPTDVRPEPINLAPDLDVVDYRFGISYGFLEGSTQMFIEIASTSPGIQTSPYNVLVTFSDMDKNVLAEGIAFPLVGFIAESGSDFLRAESFSDFDPRVDDRDTVGFSIDGDWPFSQSEYDPEAYSLESLAEERGEDYWVGKGLVRNNTPAPTDSIKISVVFRDADGRYAGYGDEFIRSPVPPDRTANFTVDVGRNTSVPTDPFQFFGDDDYTVDLIVQ